MKPFKNLIQYIKDVAELVRTGPHDSGYFCGVHPSTRARVASLVEEQGGDPQSIKMGDYYLCFDTGYSTLAPPDEFHKMYQVQYTEEPRIIDDLQMHRFESR